MAHGDFTGNLKATLARQHAEEQALAAKHMSLVSQVVEEGTEGVIDLIPDGYEDFESYQLGKAAEITTFEKIRAESLRKAFPGRFPEKTDTDDVEETLELSPENEPVVFRCSDTVDLVSLGGGTENIFNLKARQTYRAPKWAYDHLDRQELVWH